jgi:hypothetical protein
MDRMQDVRYASAVDAIYTMTDDVIAFSLMLVDALTERAKRKRRHYVKQFGPKGAPTVSSFDFSESKDFLPALNEDHLDRFRGMLKAGFTDPGKTSLIIRMRKRFKRSPSGSDTGS